jgi:hypothetical protein
MDGPCGPREKMRCVSYVNSSSVDGVSSFKLEVARPLESNLFSVLQICHCYEDHELHLKHDIFDFFF